MKNIQNIKKHLLALSDIEWFKYICKMLKNDNNPNVRLLLEVFGVEDPNSIDPTRNSMWLKSFDKRFSFISISPKIQEENNKMMTYLSFYGTDFNLRVGDVIKIFSKHLIAPNLYDGGTQIFFHPIPRVYSFDAIELWTPLDRSEVEDMTKLEVNSLNFQTGKTLSNCLTGYCLIDK